MYQMTIIKVSLRKLGCVPVSTIGTHRKESSKERLTVAILERRRGTTQRAHNPASPPVDSGHSSSAHKSAHACSIW